MGERSQSPGLIARKRKYGLDRLYWSADKVSRKAKGYPERLIPLPKDATEAEIIDLCETYTARLKLWIDRGPAPDGYMMGRSVPCATPSNAILSRLSAMSGPRPPALTPTASRLFARLSPGVPFGP